MSYRFVPVPTALLRATGSDDQPTVVAVQPTHPAIDINEEDDFLRPPTSRPFVPVDSTEKWQKKRPRRSVSVPIAADLDEPPREPA